MDFDEDEAFMGSGEEAGDTSADSGDDDDGIDVAMEHGLPLGSGKDEPFEYQILSAEQIVEEMSSIIRQVAVIVHWPHTVCRILLHQYKWNKESLLERFYDAQNPDQFFQQAHVICPLNRQNANNGGCVVSSNQLKNVPDISARLNRSSNDEICLICCLSQPRVAVQNQNLTGLQCGHRFCITCWNQYLKTKVMEEGRGQTISCPEHKCDIFVDDSKAMELIRDEAVRRRYQHLITNSFVECNRLLKWCPGTDCGRAVKVVHCEARPVTCACSFIFCFACCEEWHEPVKCHLLKLWKKKCSDDSETSNWLSANTKECPKCSVTIEKDGGCNHMTCKSASCKMEFCWMCLGPWAPHGSSWYACNRFDDSAAKQARDAQEHSRAALQRYLHYYNRYTNHANSLRLENRLYATVKTKMEQMQQQNMSWIEVQFLKRAVDVLGQCRRTLMYTYAFAFYLVKDNQADIFEENQRDLEMATEQLSEFLERDMENENLVSLKQKVQDKYRYVEQRRDKVLKHCAEGYEKNTWRFTANSRC